MDATQRSVREEAVLGAVVRWAHEATQSAAADLAAHGLTSPTYQALLAITAAPGQTQSWLGSSRGTTRSNASLLVTQLVERGLAFREADGAAQRVFISEAGSRLLNKVVPEHRRWTTDHFAELSDVELDQLAGLVRKLGTFDTDTDTDPRGTGDAHHR